MWAFQLACMYIENVDIDYIEKYLISSDQQPSVKNRTTGILATGSYTIMQVV